MSVCVIFITVLFTINANYASCDYDKLGTADYTAVNFENNVSPHRFKTRKVEKKRFKDIFFCHIEYICSRSLIFTLFIAHALLSNVLNY